jgi:hypothetical protein
MGIIGFLIGAFIVILLRWAQDLTPIWDAQIGFTLAAFTAAGLFVWGMGAVDPSVNQHPHEPSEAQLLGIVPVEEGHEAEEPEAEPIRVLGNTFWQVTFAVIVIGVILGALAVLPTGFFLRVSNDPDASTANVGYYSYTIPLLDAEVQMSQLTTLVLFSIAVFAGLGIVGGALGWTFTMLSEGVATSRANEGIPLGYAEAPPETLLQRFMMFSAWAVLIVILFFVHYYLLVGFALQAIFDLVGANAHPEWLRAIVSAGAAVTIATIMVYGMFFIRTTAHMARNAARALRELPHGLQ